MVAIGWENNNIIITYFSDSQILVTSTIYEGEIIAFNDDFI